MATGPVSPCSQQRSVRSLSSSNSSANSGLLPHSSSSRSEDGQGGASSASGRCQGTGVKYQQRWTLEEDTTLLVHVLRFGTSTWGSLQEEGKLPLRDNKACCNRFILLKRKHLGAKAFSFGGDDDAKLSLQPQTQCSSAGLFLAEADPMGSRPASKGHTPSTCQHANGDEAPQRPDALQTEACGAQAGKPPGSPSAECARRSAAAVLLAMQQRRAGGGSSKTSAGGLFDAAEIQHMLREAEHAATAEDRSAARAKDRKLVPSPKTPRALKSFKGKQVAVGVTPIKAEPSLYEPAGPVQEGPLTPLGVEKRGTKRPRGCGAAQVGLPAFQRSSIEPSAAQDFNFKRASPTASNTASVGLKAEPFTVKAHEGCAENSEEDVKQLSQHKLKLAQAQEAACRAEALHPPAEAKPGVGVSHGKGFIEDLELPLFADDMGLDEFALPDWAAEGAGFFPWGDASVSGGGAPHDPASMHTIAAGLTGDSLRNDTSLNRQESMQSHVTHNSHDPDPSAAGLEPADLTGMQRMPVLVEGLPQEGRSEMQPRCNWQEACITMVPMGRREEAASMPLRAPGCSEPDEGGVEVSGRVGVPRMHKGRLPQAEVCRGGEGPVGGARDAPVGSVVDAARLLLLLHALLQKLAEARGLDCATVQQPGEALKMLLSVACSKGKMDASECISLLEMLG